MTPDPYPREEFPHTTQAVQAALTGVGGRQALCRKYAAPVYTVVAGHHRTPAAGEVLDLTHDFLSHFFLEPELRFAAYLTLPDPRPLFRAYVIASVDFFLISAIRKNTAAKRGGGRVRVELDADPGRYEPLLRDKGLTPDERAEAASAMDHYWRAAGTVLRELEEAPGRPADRALIECHRAGKPPDLKAIAARFELTAKFVEGRWAAVRAREALVPYLDDDTPPPFDRLAAELGMEPNTVRVQFHRLRGEVEEVLLRELEDECGAAGRPDRVRESAAELAKLLGVLRRVREEGAGG